MRHKQQLKKLLDSTNICFLSSVNQAGFPVTRGMLKPIKMEDDFIYLHNNTSSSKVQQFIENPKACLYFCDELNFRGITLLGSMEVLTKEEDKIGFWKDEYKIYYENGEGITDFTVLKFGIVNGKYYHDFK